MRRLKMFSTDSPVGEVVALADDERMWAVILAGDDPSESKTKAKVDAFLARSRAEVVPGSSPVLREFSRQLASYFRGELRSFELPVFAVGTDFQKEVWSAVSGVRYGCTVTYADLAERCGRKRSSCRAAAGAVGANPLPLVVPCHRIVGSGGTLGGFGSGTRTKRFLLDLEADFSAAQCRRGRATASSSPKP